MLYGSVEIGIKGPTFDVKGKLKTNISIVWFEIFDI